MTPRVSVLLSVYNGEKYIKQAVESILNQTFRDFELIIVNDGSTDATTALLTEYKDPRIIVVVNEKNIGLVKSLNKGLKIARGEFIARMDADDISVADRFEKQILYLDKHLGVGVLGTAMQQIGANGKVISVITPPVAHPMIFWTIFFDLAVIHASVMMRKSVVDTVGGYNENFIHIEDTELWSRLIHVTRFANLREVLYIRRLHGTSIMNTQSVVQIKRGIEIRSALLKNVLHTEIPSSIAAWFSYPETFLTKDEQKKLISILIELSNAVILKSQPVDVVTQNNMQEDLMRKITLVTYAGKFRFVKILMRWLKKILPAALRHRLRMSTVGQGLKRIIK